MPKLSILAPAAIVTVLLSAMVLASSPTDKTLAIVATAPNRADVFTATACGPETAAVGGQASC